MQRPPDGVKMVIEAVCIMKGIKPKKVAGDKVSVILATADFNFSYKCVILSCEES